MRCWLVMLVVLVACADRDVDGLASVKDKVCACKTASCAEQEITHVPKTTVKSRHVQELARAIQDCLAKRKAAELPTAEPDTEGSADTPEASQPTQAPGAAASAAKQP